MGQGKLDWVGFDCLYKIILTTIMMKMMLTTVPALSYICKGLNSPNSEIDFVTETLYSS